MRILIALTYYRPYTSGLTLYAERLARALVRRGHTVQVLAAQHKPDLPLRETLDGVGVTRVPVALRVSKGFVMLGFPAAAWKLLRQSDAVNVHLPQLDAAPVALLSRLAGKPLVATYHCDLTLAPGLLNRLANLASDLANMITVGFAQAVVHNTRDYALASPFLSRRMEKLRFVYPPVELGESTSAEVEAFCQKFGLSPSEEYIGMAARLAAEKGVEIMAQALPRIVEQRPHTRLLYVGEHKAVPGEEAYARRLKPHLERLGNRWTFLGLLTQQELSAFFKLCAVIAVPSTNPTESFGLTQVEAMASGTPVVATDRPGMRLPVQETGMGRLFPQGDAAALADAVLAILADPEAYRGHPEELLRRTAPEQVAEEYEQIFAAR